MRAFGGPAFEVRLHVGGGGACSSAIRGRAAGSSTAVAGPINVKAHFVNVIAASNSNLLVIEQKVHSVGHSANECKNAKRSARLNCGGVQFVGLRAYCQMGIKKLLPLLKSSGATRPYGGLSGRVAIDVPIFAHRFIYTARTIPNLLVRFKRFAEELQTAGAEPVFVFDGASLDLKGHERDKRGEARRKRLDTLQQRASDQLMSLEALGFDLSDAGAGGPDGTGAGSSGAPDGLAAPLPSVFFTGILFPTRKDYKTLRGYLDTLGYETRAAKYEAEALCAHLSATGNVTAVITEDSDAVAFGAERVVFRYGYATETYEVHRADALEALNLSERAFQSFCALLGCDFCENVSGIGPVNALKLVKKYGAWPEIYAACRHMWPAKTQGSADAFHELWPRVNECFATRAFEAAPEATAVPASEPAETATEAATEPLSVAAAADTASDDCKMES